jgi:hypothetical protein
MRLLARCTRRALRDPAILTHSDDRQNWLEFGKAAGVGVRMAVYSNVHSCRDLYCWFYLSGLAVNWGLLDLLDPPTGEQAVDVDLEDRSLPTVKFELRGGVGDTGMIEAVGTDNPRLDKVVIG